MRPICPVVIINANESQQREWNSTQNDHRFRLFGGGLRIKLIRPKSKQSRFVVVLLCVCVSLSHSILIWIHAAVRSYHRISSQFTNVMWWSAAAAVCFAFRLIESPFRLLGGRKRFVSIFVCEQTNDDDDDSLEFCSDRKRNEVGCCLEWNGMFIGGKQRAVRMQLSFLIIKHTQQWSWSRVKKREKYHDDTMMMMSEMRWRTTTIFEGRWSIFSSPSSFLVAGVKRSAALAIKTNFKNRCSSSSSSSSPAVKSECRVK